MRNFQKFILFYCLGIIIYALISLLFSEYIPIHFTRFTPWITIFIAIVVGYLLNFRSNNYSKNKPPIVGYIIALSAITLITFTFKGMDWYYEKYQANVEQNKTALKNLNNHDKETIEIAFRKLESNFSSSNDFRLHSLHSKERDTIINNATLQSNDVYFKYFIGHDFKQEYKAIIAVYNKNPTIISINEKQFNVSGDLNPNTVNYH